MSKSRKEIFKLWHSYRVIERSYEKLDPNQLYIVYEYKNKDLIDFPYIKFVAKDLCDAVDKIDSFFSWNGIYRADTKEKIS